MKLGNIREPFFIGSRCLKIPFDQIVRYHSNGTFVGTVSARLALHTNQSFLLHQPLDLLMVDLTAFVLKLRGNPAVAIHAFVFGKDVSHPADEGLVLFIFVRFTCTVIVCGPFYSGNSQKDLQLILLPQFFNNTYFFFCCRAFLA